MIWLLWFRRPPRLPTQTAARRDRTSPSCAHVAADDDDVDNDDDDDCDDGGKSMFLSPNWLNWLEGPHVLDISCAGPTCALGVPG